MHTPALTTSHQQHFSGKTCTAVLCLLTTKKKATSTDNHEAIAYYGFNKTFIVVFVAVAVVNNV